MKPQGSELYERIIERDTAYIEPWNATPWMINVYVGPISEDRYLQIREWLKETFGPERGYTCKTGRWYSDIATPNGWQWIGFSNEKRLNEFKAQWIPEYDR